MESLARELPVEPAFINLGGGWRKLTPEKTGALLTQPRKAFSSRCSIFMEPGHWYARDTGFCGLQRGQTGAVR